MPQLEMPKKLVEIENGYKGLLKVLQILRERSETATPEESAWMKAVDILGADETTKIPRKLKERVERYLRELTECGWAKKNGEGKFAPYAYYLYEKNDEIIRHAIMEVIGNTTLHDPDFKDKALHTRIAKGNDHFFNAVREFLLHRHRIIIDTALPETRKKIERMTNELSPEIWSYLLD